MNDARNVGGVTVFEIASLTKVLTALLLADQARQGQVKADAPEATCLPERVQVPQHDRKSSSSISPRTARVCGPIVARPRGRRAVLATAVCNFFPNDDAAAQFVFSQSGPGPALSITLNQDGSSWKAERVEEEGKP